MWGEGREAPLFTLPWWSKASLLLRVHVVWTPAGPDHNAVSRIQSMFHACSDRESEQWLPGIFTHTLYAQAVRSGDSFCQNLETINLWKLHPNTLRNSCEKTAALQKRLLVLFVCLLFSLKITALQKRLYTYICFLHRKTAALQKQLFVCLCREKWGEVPLPRISQQACLLLLLTGSFGSIFLPGVGGNSDKNFQAMSYKCLHFEKSVAFCWASEPTTAPVSIWAHCSISEQSLMFWHSAQAKGRQKAHTLQGNAIIASFCWWRVPTLVIRTGLLHIPLGY